MHFVKFFVVFVALIGTMSFSAITTDTKKLSLPIIIEEAAFKIIMNCYKDIDKTVVVVGPFSDNFVGKISSLRSFNLVLLDHGTRPMKNIVYSHDYYKTTYKTHIAVVLGTEMNSFLASLLTYINSPYFNTMASILTISSIPEKGFSREKFKIEVLNMMVTANVHDMINVNMLYGDNRKKQVLFSSNPFVPKAPRPWTNILSVNIPNRIPPLTIFRRPYLANEKICENLNFDKTRSLGGLRIKTVRTGLYCTECELRLDLPKQDIMMQILYKKMNSFMEQFFTYVNATEDTIMFDRSKQVPMKPVYLYADPQYLRVKLKRNHYVYPHGVVCMFLLTYFRGNKTQLQKIISLIDGYTWIGLFIVSLSSVIFFKYFLRRPAMEAFLNIVRLTCNCGLLMTPSNIALQIYLACLLFVVVTMQGIFASTLAALLTQDIPVRQVNSIRDVAELGYQIYAPEPFIGYFKDIVPEDRIFIMEHEITCITYMLRNNTFIACLDHMYAYINSRDSDDLYRSKCIANEYYTHGIPRYWPFEEILNKFFSTLIEGGIDTDLKTIAVMNKFFEVDAMEDIRNPRSINFGDLQFAFKLLAIGLGFASIIFVIEIMIYRHQNGVRKTRIVVLNSRGA